MSVYNGRDVYTDRESKGVLWSIRSPSMNIRMIILFCTEGEGLSTVYEDFNSIAVF